MIDDDTKRSDETSETQDEKTIKFTLENMPSATSAELIRTAEPLRPIDIYPVEESTDEVVSPIFKELSAPKLPELSKENRAKLLMQTPNRLFFYWTVGKNPFKTLNRVVGSDTGSYSLVVKLVNLKSDVEELHAAESEGSWWFDVDADTPYRAEIGFYAPNRPYVRIMYSNVVETPRKSPSPRVASSADWTVASDKFAQVLDVAGFSQDAFDVALAGDDRNAAENATQSAFSQFIGEPKINVSAIDSEEIRFVMLALASGVPLEYLRFRIGPSLFAILQEHAEKLSSENALAAMREHFGIYADEILEEEPGPAVFGASLINFPRVLKKNRKGVSSWQQR